MNEMREAIRRLNDERRLLERAWDSTQRSWNDSRRREFESQVVVPLVTETTELVREMDMALEEVRRALKLLS